MMNLGYRLAAALTLVSGAAISMGVGIAFSHAAANAPDLSDLREAVTAAAKRGDNVDEIRKALDGLQKSLANGWTAPEPGKTVEPPAELVTLHDAVDAAARKGENVEEIRTQLEGVEKAMLGKTLNRPKPQPPALIPSVEPIPQIPFNPGRRLPAMVPPAFPGLGIDRDAMQKAQDMTRRASELLLQNPNDPEANKMMQDAQDLMLRALTGPGLAPGLMPLPAPGIGRVPDRFRLGVRLEKVSELAADQLGLEVARGIGIADVVPGTPAEKAGFRTHDIVLEFAGKPVTDSPEDFTRQVAKVKGGEKVDAVVMRKGKKVEIKGIEMPELPQAFPQREIGDLQPRFQLDVPGPIPQLADGRQPRGGNSVAVANVNGDVIIKAVHDGVKYDIQARQTGEMIDVVKIAIVDGDKKVEAEKVDKLPDNYRPVVERLLKSVGARKATVHPKD